MHWRLAKNKIPCRGPFEFLLLNMLTCQSSQGVHVRAARGCTWEHPNGPSPLLASEYFHWNNRIKSAIPVVSRDTTQWTPQARTQGCTLRMRVSQEAWGQVSQLPTSRVHKLQVLGSYPDINFIRHHLSTPILPGRKLKNMKSQVDKGNL